MKVWLLFDDYGVSGEGPWLRSAHATEEGARSAGPSECYGGRRYGDAGPVQDSGHDCKCEGTWWYISEVEVLP